jgi:hypothetical protein
MFSNHLRHRILVFFSANQYASNAKRKTVAVQDIFKALQTNQFDMLVEPLQEALKGKRRKSIDWYEPFFVVVYLDYQEQMRKKKEEVASKKQQNQSEATVENDEEENNEPTDE